MGIAIRSTYIGTRILVPRILVLLAREKPTVPRYSWCNDVACLSLLFSASVPLSTASQTHVVVVKDRDLVKVVKFILYHTVLFAQHTHLN